MQTEFQPTYLYIKQHMITKKLYFGKTTQDPIKYKGSGKYWKLHIKLHGKQYIETLWFCLFMNKEEINKFAMLFSSQHNIIESDDWANLMFENGKGGGANYGTNNGMFGKTHTHEVRKFLSENNKGRFLGKSYEEIYGEEKTIKLKEFRSKKFKQRFVDDPNCNIGASNPNSKSYEFISPTNEIFLVTGELKKFCKANCLCVPSIIDVLKGRRDNYKGWTAKYISTQN